MTDPDSDPTPPEPVTLHTKIDLDDLAAQIVDTCTHEDLFDLIKAIDDGCADLDFSKRLSEHLAQVVKEKA